MQLFLVIFLLTMAMDSIEMSKSSSTISLESTDATENETATAYRCDRNCDYGTVTVTDTPNLNALTRSFGLEPAKTEDNYQGKRALCRIVAPAMEWIKNRDWVKNFPLPQLQIRFAKFKRQTNLIRRLEKKQKDCFSNHRRRPQETKPDAIMHLVVYEGVILNYQVIN